MAVRLMLPAVHTAALIIDGFLCLADTTDDEDEAWRCRWLADSIGDQLDALPRVDAPPSDG